MMAKTEKWTTQFIVSRQQWLTLVEGLSRHWLLRAATAAAAAAAAAVAAAINSKVNTAVASMIRILIIDDVL